MGGGGEVAGVGAVEAPDSSVCHPLVCAPVHIEPPQLLCKVLESHLKLHLLFMDVYSLSWGPTQGQQT